jgi:V-type H+-transporting ATPase subunit a
MGILRSETMAHGLMVIPAERARRVLNTLGHTAPIEFIDSADPKDLNLVRPYKKYVGRIDTVLKHTKQIIGDVEKLAPDTIVTGRVETFLDRDGERDMFQMDDLEAMIEKRQRQFAFFRRNKESIDAEIAMCLEERFVMELAVKVLGSPPKGAPGKKAEEASLLANEGGMKGDAEMSFSNVAGTCNASDVARIARQVFRATRGNTFTIHEDIDHDFWDAKAEKNVRKAVFSIYFQGGASSAMYDKVYKLCQSSGCSLFTWATSRADAERRLAAAKTQVADKEKAQEAYSRSMQTETDELTRIEHPNANSWIEDVRLFLEKERAIYVTLNMFEGGGSTLRTRCWYPAVSGEAIKEALVHEGKGLSTAAFLIDEQAPRGVAPPTFIPRNALTDAFQELIDTYGTPAYKEANPALFATVTFPFIFGIMYGDVFHGGCLFLVGLYACINAEKLRYDVPGLYYGRFIILMMGFFAVYAGFLYNDFLSLGVNLFPSRWKEGPRSGNDMTLLPDDGVDVGFGGDRGPYPFGLDPAWHGAENELLFVNSLKMKTSVIVGVAQMMLGLALRCSNAIYNSNFVDLLCECVPMWIFMVCFFGYMDWMIIYKWVTPTTTNPSLINSMISMGLGQADKAPLYDSQVEVQGWLMTLTMISVPWLLIPKVVVEYVKSSSASKDDDHEEHDFSEVVIHQVIETIEYVLGTVSHTASYLRQWALSLAHQQLSVVFFQKAMLGALTSGNPVAIYFAFAVLMAITAGVLLGMDVLECFLHTLRLHWVEFQSKFFKAGGNLFTPFSHAATLKPVEGA